MNIPEVNIKQLLEAGVHLGHKTLRWNPKMKKFIFGEKNSIHIIDLTKTVVYFKNALAEVYKCISSGGKILIVSTKKQASEQVLNLAKETDQFYVNYRWLGGMLTNWNTIQNSIKRLKMLEETLAKEDTGFTKKEILKRTKEKDKLQRLMAEGIRQKNLQAEYNRVEKELNQLLPLVNEANLAATELKRDIKFNTKMVKKLDPFLKNGNMS